MPGPARPEASDECARPAGRWVLLGGALLLLVLTAVQVLPAPGDLGSHVVPNAGDPVLVTWILEHQARALLDEPSRLYAGNIFHPEPAAIAWSDNLTALVPAYLAAWLATGRDSIAAYNAVTFAAFAGSALAVLLLARRLLDSAGGAVVAATAATLAMVRRSAIGHTQLAGFLFLFLAAALLVDLVEERRLRSAVLAGCALAGLWYTAAYGFVLAAVLVPVAAVAWALTHRHELDLRLGALVAVTAAVTAVLVAPSLPPYLDLQARAGFERSDAELTTIGAESFTQPPSPLYRALDQADGSTEGTDGFVGWTVLALAAVAVAAAVATTVAHGRRADPAGGAPGTDPSVHPGSAAVVPPGSGASVRRRRSGPALLVAAATAALLSLGPDDGLLSLPYRALREVVPGLDSARVLSRFWVVPAAALALLAGRGLERLVAGRPPAVRAVAGVVVLALLVGELVVRPGASRVDDEGPVLAPNLALARLEDGPVTELPVPVLPHYPYVLAARQLRSLHDGLPRVEGYSGDAPAGLPAFQQAVASFPADGALDALRTAGVRHVVLHAGPAACASRYGPAELDRIVRAAAASDDVEDVVELDGGAIVTLTPGPPARPLTSILPAPPPERPDVACDRV